MISETLTTARLTLRRPHADDVPGYTAFCTSERSRFGGGPFPPEEAFEKLATMAGQWILRGYGRYVMALDGVGIGHVGPLHLDDRRVPEMTWTLWDGAQEGNGYATEAAQAVTAHLMDVAGWPEMTILILPENTASHAIARRLGAELTDRPAPDWYPRCRTYRLTGRGAP